MPLSPHRSLILSIAMHMVNVVIYEFVFIFLCKIRPRWCAPPLPSLRTYFGSGYMWLERQAKCNILVYFYPLEVAAHSSPNERTNERQQTIFMLFMCCVSIICLSILFCLRFDEYPSVRRQTTAAQTNVAECECIPGASESDIEQNKRKWKCRRKANVRARLQTLRKWLGCSWLALTTTSSTHSENMYIFTKNCRCRFRRQAHCKMKRKKQRKCAWWMCER